MQRIQLLYVVLMIFTTKRVKDLSLIFTLLLISVVITAQGEEARPYKIELILFAPRTLQADQAIDHSFETEGPDIDNAVEIAAELSNPDQLNSPFLALPLTETGLAKETSLLIQSGHYEVITHLIWQQPGLDHASARPVHIHGGTDYRDQFPERLQASWSLDENDQLVQSSALISLEQIDGTIKFVVGRYLHVYTDLVFRRPILEETEYNDGNVQRSFVLADYRIRAHRRMRSQELHYLDHPLLGILIEITPTVELEN